MRSCIYNTDADWLTVLKRNQFKEGVNFWRKDQRNFKIAPGSAFYFKINGTKLIAGRARYIQQASLSIEDAWKRFGVRNGAISEEELRSRAAKILGIKQDAKLNCLILGEIELLNEQDYIELLDKEFPAPVMGAKYFSEQSIARIENEFSLRLPNQPASTGDLVATFAKIENERLFNPDAISTARETALRAIAIRRGQPEFRQKILSAYSGTCAVSGETTLGVLEAAHIVPYRGSDTNTIQNGLLLRADWHTLFDLGYWWIDDKFQIVVAEVLKGSYYYAQNGKLLHLPQKLDDHPSPDALKIHRESSNAKNSR